MRWSLAITGFVCGLGYAIVYSLLAFPSTGGGHGAALFVAPAFPYGIGLLFFPVAGFFLGDLRPLASKVLFLWVAVTHYTLVLAYIGQVWYDDWGRLHDVWDRSPWYILPPAGFYLGGHILMWVAFVRSIIAARFEATQQIVGPERGSRVSQLD